MGRDSEGYRHRHGYVYNMGREPGIIDIAGGSSMTSKAGFLTRPAVVLLQIYTQTGKILTVGQM